MFYVDDILFSVSLALGVCLVAGSALGLGDLDSGTDAETDADADALEPDGGGTDPVSVLGLGRVPLFVAALIFSLTFGVLGFLLAPGWRAILPSAGAPVASLGVAFVLAWLSTRALTRFLARLLPTTESYAGRKSELVGSLATVIVATRRGDAVLRAIDAGGAELRLLGNCHDRDFRPGQRLSLVSYDPASDRFEIDVIDP
jgi:hypothetical protein